jgi:SAM-dependent methyltransferase
MISYDLHADGYRSVRNSHSDISPLLQEFGFEQPENTVLDLGAGNLRETTHLGRQVKLLVAADRSTSMLGGGQPGINRVCLDFDRSLPFSNEAFSHVVMISSIHHAKDKSILLRELRRVLADAGQFVAITNTPEQILSRWTYQFFGDLAERNASRFLEQDEAYAIFSSSGFELEIRTLIRPPIPIDEIFFRRFETRIFDSAFFLIPDICWAQGLQLARAAFSKRARATYKRDRVALIARKV